MLLYRQLQFDLAFFRMNRLKYVGYFFLVINFGACIVGAIEPDRFNGLLIMFLQYLFFIFMMCTYNMTFDHGGIVFSIRKLRYYPITKGSYLTSRLIFLMICISLLVFSSMLGMGMGSILMGRLLDANQLREMIGYSVFTGALAFLLLSCIYNITALLILLISFTPLYLNVFQMISDNKGPEEWLVYFFIIGVVDILFNGLFLQTLTRR